MEMDDLAGLELSPAQFEAVRTLVYNISRINLHAGKEVLVRTRLTKRLRDLGLNSFDAYLEHVAADTSGHEVAALVDILTTNKTSFFREAQHFDFLRSTVFPVLAGGNAPLRFWCAGCSSGEEPYTLAMLLREELPDLDQRDVRILATDISARALTKAREGIYSAERVAEVPPALRRRYLSRVGTTSSYRIADSIRGMVRFARHNLMGEWPMRGPFDVIFCRNVMIYFDRKTQEELVNRFWELLRSGGYLFVGHSESLTGLAHRFSYVQPATYRK